ncbi:iron-containing alcohol dehydrogenase [Thermoanaerobacterium sp. RBIITD]|uniref:iron-containing alcohol dehydrogenase n=1 Tax=Thermoanaerobacterium sp. RBIITD TaxID=1550240 RepID=UPI000BB8FFE0|nr:iron-containing alcohol dehydrogenase [Thermoanaerobacterium sp. RBIITD]SNX54729.1 alcohol dehydrogenase [Thermoanaerobacterium sp. RBIITD]
MSQGNLFTMPFITLIGKDCLLNLGNKISKISGKKALIVTDKFMIKAGFTEKIQKILGEYSIKSTIFDGVIPNPNVSAIKNAVKCFINNECDTLISLGGGSAHDTAKGVKLVLLKNNELCEDKNIKLVCVNTTAGTGSEVTRFCVITDELEHRKITIVDEKVIPDIAVDDPLLMIGLPPKLTAETGMDALTHAIEAYTSVDHYVLSDISALKAISLVFDNLYECYSNGKNIDAREQMVYAEYLAGVAFSNVGVGLVHAMSHQLSGLYNLPHGLCNAVLLPFVMEYNLDVNCRRYADIMRSLKKNIYDISDSTAADNLICDVIELNRKLEIPSNIKDLKVNESDFELLSDMALIDNTLKTNAKKPSKKDIIEIYRKAYYGIHKY